jgi:hypothetical protein
MPAAGVLLLLARTRHSNINFSSNENSLSPRVFDTSPSKYDDC